MDARFNLRQKGMMSLKGVMIALPLAAVVLPVQAQNADLRGVITDMAESMLGQEMDRQAFQAAQSANSISAYRNYLERYPRGLHRADAERALERLGDRSPTPETRPDRPAPDRPGDNSAERYAANEAALRMSRSQRIEVQQQLTRLGYNTGGADGLWGRNTRNALSDWQKAQRFSATGYITAEQLQALRRQAGGASDTGNSTGPRPQTEEALLDLSRQERRDIQTKLTALGYNTRGADGAFGRNTRNAIARWQGDFGHSETGYLNADQLRELRNQRLR